MTRSALIGSARYIATRPKRAMTDTGDDLMVASDHNDSVGAINSYSPDADFLTEFERFDRHVDKM